VAAAVSLSVADRLAILEVITRADEAASRRDADGYVALLPRMPCSAQGYGP
jgi:hypothetical protein